MDAEFSGTISSKDHIEFLRNESDEEEQKNKVKALPDRNSYLSLPSLFSNASTADSYIPTNKFPKD
jgi:hypothetical protein